MTYRELLRKTGQRKQEILKQYRDDGVFRLVADADPSGLASFLAKPFLEELSDDIRDIYDSAGDDFERLEIYGLYASYMDGTISYDDLPNEAKITE